MASRIIRKVISTPKAPAAVGPYSQAIQVNETLYVSGQIGFNPETMELAAGGAAGETEQAMKNLEAILIQAGATFSNVVKTTVLLRSIDDYTKVNEVYGRYFGTPRPARVAYQVAALPKGAAVEIDAIAVVGHVQDE